MSGRSSAVCQATGAPQSCPTTYAFSSPRAWISPTTSPTRWRMVYASTSSGWSLRPYPRWSGATTRKPASARGPNWWCQECHDSGSRAGGLPRAVALFGDVQPNAVHVNHSMLNHVRQGTCRDLRAGLTGSPPHSCRSEPAKRLAQRRTGSGRRTGRSASARLSSGRSLSAADGLGAGPGSATMHENGTLLRRRYEALFCFASLMEGSPR